MSKDVVLAAADVTVSFERAGIVHQVLGGIDLEIKKGEFVCIVGPSGCGKTTLLRTLGGLLTPTEGNVYKDGQALTSPDRDVSIVFQDYSRALCPWRTAIGNVELTLEAVGVPRRERRPQALAALELVDICGHHAYNHPRMMSGGMQQRIQIARAIARNPSVLLMDEPFASLDALTKFQLEDLMIETWRKLGQTVILVTHDLDEAVYMADRVIVLSKGPSRVIEEVSVGIERPRSQATTKADPRFVTLRTQLFKLISGATNEVAANV